MGEADYENGPFSKLYNEYNNQCQDTEYLWAARSIQLIGYINQMKSLN